MAQVWADQCASVIYPRTGDRDRRFPRLFHERGTDRVTERFQAPPGVGQNIAWALTADLNFTKIIDDLWYRDVSNFELGYVEDFREVHYCL